VYLRSTTIVTRFTEHDDVIKSLLRGAPHLLEPALVAPMADKWQHHAWTFHLRHPLLPSTRLDGPQLPYFKSSVRPDREWNPTNHQWSALSISREIKQSECVSLNTTLWE